MNTNHLKKFAQSARRKLLSQVAAKLDYVLTHDTAELREQATAIKKLKTELERVGKEQLVEKVSYIWFNRLMALRFMDANDYQPGGIRIVSARDGESLPEVLQEAKQGGLTDPAWRSKMSIVNDILDGKLNSKNPQNEAYRHLLVGACNQLSRQFPFLFEMINDYAELLLPDDLTSEFSIVYDVVEGMSTEDCAEVEIIGWLYQFYISEKKDEVFAAPGKVKKEDIPAATQLFTPRWIVEYMVQNTLGKLWLMNNPSSSLRDHMEYFKESPSMESDDYLVVESVEDIDFLDQACGSGHILVYAFELFAKIYEEQGYTASEIPKLIIEKNLHGFEIDDRAAQLAGFALMMKARQYHPRVFSKDIRPYIICFQDHRLTKEEVADTFDKLDIEASEELIDTIDLMRQATNLGSLIVPEGVDEMIHNKLALLLKNADTSDAFLMLKVNALRRTIRQLIPMSKKYHCIVDNPPYMGGGNMNKPLADYVKKNYMDSKADLMACFMEAGLAILLPKGYLGMINQMSWLFLDYFKRIRYTIISDTQVDSLLLLGARTFEEISGEIVQSASFVLINEKVQFESTCFKLDSCNTSASKREAFTQGLFSYRFNQLNALILPNSPFGFWFSEERIKIFGNNSPLADFADVRAGLQTGDNNQFIREWHEIESNSLTDHKSPKKEKWYIYNKGGSYNKWYGNKNLVVNWENNGHDIISDKLSRLEQGKILVSNSKPKNTQYYFREGLTYSTTGGKAPSFRILSSTELFDIKGSSIFINSNIKLNYLLALLNSKLTEENIKVLSPNLDSNPGYIAKLPIIYCPKTKLEEITELCLSISRNYEAFSETSKDFRSLNLDKTEGLEEYLDLLIQLWTNKFHQLHKSEEELNKHFIEIYGLQKELTPDVPLTYITILRDELDQKKLKEISELYQSGWILKDQKEWVLPSQKEKPNLSFDVKEIMAQFISYTVGCMMGRYSLDKEGLILANAGDSLEQYTEIVGKQITELTFEPDDDAIIPVLDDEWFEDDIVGRFLAFLKASFGEKDFAKNLQYLEQQLGKDIRKYFVKDFYKDHIKRYKKRPIYWIFSSPKGHFRVLVYLHRYTPDTLNNILNDYLRDFIQKLEAQKQHYQQLQETGSASEQTKAIKEIDKLDKMILDCQEYERDILYPLATERITIDLDDGVLVNYNKFGKAVELVKGLNDAKAKKKVRGFDWIDVSAIRD